MEFNVIIDIDGVITNLDFLKASRKSKHTVLDTSHDEIKNLIVRKMIYGVVSLYSTHASVRNDASEVISALKNEGATIKIITKRLFGTEDSVEGERIRKKVELHLLEHGIPYDIIRFVDSNKVKECIEENADTIIEDNPNNILALAAAGFKVICFRTSYNEHIVGDNINIFIAHNWQQVLVLCRTLRMMKINNINLALQYILKGEKNEKN